MEVPEFEKHDEIIITGQSVKSECLSQFYPEIIHCFEIPSWNYLLPCVGASSSLAHRALTFTGSSTSMTESSDGSYKARRGEK